MKRRGCFKNILIGIGILILLSFCVSILGRDDKQGAALANTPRPTNTPVPTPTFTVFDQLDFVTYPDNYKGAFVQVRGEVHNINSDTQLQIYLENSRDSLYITADEPYEKIYEGDTVIVTGYVKGKTCGKNVFGAKICSPGINKAIVTKLD